MYDLTIILNADSDKCLYEQIYEYIQSEIMEGKLLQGERLPSARSLAEKLLVSRSTVDLAYEQLVAEGYLEARPKRGFFVAKVDDLLTIRKGEEENQSRKERVSLEDGIALDGTGTKNGPREDAGVIDFSPYGIDMSGFPFGVWKKITKDILSQSNSKLFSQGEVQGDYSLRLTISRYLHSARGVNCTPEQIVVGAGQDYLLLLLEKILGRHVRIAMENPTYMRAYRVFQSMAYQVETVDMDENGMLVSELEKRDVSCVYVMPSHQYPTGAVMPIGRRSELLKWASKGENRYLIEDDYDSEFRYRGKPIPSLQSSDKHGKVIYMGTFSKSIAPAIRVGYMVLPKDLLEKYKEECYFFSSTVSRIDQRILDEFIRDGYFERHLNKMRKLYRDKHDLLLEGLEPFRKCFTIKGEHAGLHILLTGPKGITEEELLSKAKEAGAKVYGLSGYYIGEQKKNFATVLLGYGGLKKEEIIEGLIRLKKAWLS